MKNTNYISIIFEIISLFIWIFIIFQMINNNFNSILLLSTGGFLYFFATLSLIDENNEQ